MSEKRKTTIFTVCYLAYTLIYIARLNLSVSSASFIEAQILDSAGIGLLGGVFSVVYAFGRLVNGYISDNISPRRIIGIGLLIVGISNICMGLLPGVAGLVVLWGLNAYGQSMLWGPILRIVANTYDEQTAKKMTSYMVTSVTTGNIAGIILNTVIINKIGFEFAFVIPGIMAVIFCGIVRLTLKKVIPASSEQHEKKHIPITSLFKIPIVKRVLIPAVFHGMIKDNISVWMTVFFVDKYNINLSQTAGFILFIPIVGFIGRISYPFCHKLAKMNEHKVSVFAFALCVASAAVLCIGTVPPVIAAICLSLLYAGVSIANTSILSIFPLQFAESDNVASVSGIMDFATYFGAGVSSFIYGNTIHAFGYTGYTLMFLSWAVISVISIIALRPLVARQSCK